ncbi:MAG: hypothetical protein K2N18_00670, partial [Clostridia bacterium]|nr:hypothetical protein [Clostridia bacterium]
ANILVCPVVTAVMYFASDIQTSAEGTPAYVNSMLKLSYIVLYTLIFLAGTNMMAMLAYTREGRSFYISKSLPIKVSDSIRAKFILALLPPAIVMVIQVVLAAALYKLDVLSVILFFVCSSFAIVGASALHIYCDMRYGNVNWSTRQDLKQVSQGNKGSLLVVFGVVAIGCIALIGGMVLSAFSNMIGGKIVVLSVFWSVLFVLSAAIFVAGILVLKFKAEPFYDQIGERQFKPKTSLRGARANRGGGNMLMK